MNVCSFTEVEMITEMNNRNPYILGIVDVSCPPVRGMSVEFNLHDLERIKREKKELLPENKQFELSQFIREKYDKDIKELQPILASLGMTPKEYNYLYCVHRSGLLIDVEQIIAHILDPLLSSTVKQYTLKYYQTLVEYGFVMSAYSVLCERFELILNKLDKNAYISRDKDSLFGKIYKEYMEPTLLKLQKRFTSHIIDSKSLRNKNDHFLNYDMNNFSTHYFSNMDVVNYLDTLFRNKLNYLQATEDRVIPGDPEKDEPQSYDKQFNSMMHLLVAYNKRINELLSPFGPEYKVEQKPFKSYETLKQEFEESLEYSTGSEDDDDILIEVTID